MKITGDKIAVKSFSLYFPLPGEVDANGHKKKPIANIVLYVDGVCVEVSVTDLTVKRLAQLVPIANAYINASPLSEVIILDSEKFDPNKNPFIKD